MSRPSIVSRAVNGTKLKSIPGARLESLPTNNNTPGAIITAASGFPKIHIAIGIEMGSITGTVITIVGMKVDG
jgi:hypothetical protein